MAVMQIEYYSEALEMEWGVNVLYPDASRVDKPDDKDIPVMAGTPILSTALTITRLSLKSCHGSSSAFSPICLTSERRILSLAFPWAATDPLSWLSSLTAFHTRLVFQGL